MTKKEIREKLQDIPTVHKSEYPTSLDKPKLMKVYMDWQNVMKELQKKAAAEEEQVRKLSPSPASVR